MKHFIGGRWVAGTSEGLLPAIDPSSANATAYGRVAGVRTRSGARPLRMAKRVRSGQVFINCYGAGAGIGLPFGGTGKCGHGREKGFAALREFGTTKTIIIKHG